MTLKGLIKLTHILKDPSLTVIQWQILLVIADNPRETITDLCNQGKLNCGKPSDIAVSVKRLAEGRLDRPGLGYLKKQKHETDSRYHRLVLSAKGKRLVESLKGKIKNIK